MTKGLQIGRFQPFHLGHSRAVRYALEKSDILFIAVGSSQKSHESRNPFTAEERIRMITDSLDDLGIGRGRWLAAPVPDAPSHPEWIANLQSIFPGFDIVFSNEPLTIKILLDHGIKVLEVPLHKREIYSATEVRRRMLEDGDWEELVPDAVVRIIVDVNGVKRLSSLHTSNQVS